MGAYQAEAIAPTLARRPEGRRPPRRWPDLPKADLYISLNAHKGRPEVLTDWMDASVVDERDPARDRRGLNPFNPDNGPPYRRRSSPAIARRSGRATSASPTGPRPNWRGSMPPACRTACSRCSAPGATCGSWTRPSIRPTAAARVLSRRPRGRQPHAGHRPRQHPENLAVDVEPGDVEVPGRGATAPSSTLPPWWCRRRRTGRLPQRRPQDLRGHRLAGQARWNSSRAPTTSRMTRGARSGHVSDGRLVGSKR